MVETSVNMVLFPGDGAGEFFVGLPVPGIDAAITDHLIMLFRDVPDQPPDELHGGDRFFHVFTIFVTVVMEGDKVPIVVVDPGSGDDRTPEIAADIFDHCFWVAFVRLGIDIKTIFMLPVAAGLYFFERWADQRFHFIQ